MLVANHVTTLVESLLEEDNPREVSLAEEALRGNKLFNRVSVVQDGVEATTFLRQSGRYAQDSAP